MWCPKNEHEWVEMPMILPGGNRLDVHVCSKCGQKRLRG